MVDSEAKAGHNGKAGQAAAETAGPDPDQTTYREVAMAPAKRTTAPAFQFYPSDFLNSPKVRRMSKTERGVYITLLCLDWMDDGLPTDLDQMAADIHMPVKQLRAMWENSYLGQCFIERDGRYYNERLERERDKQSEFRRRASDHGKKGGRPKANPLPDGKGTESQPFPNPLTETGAQLKGSQSSSSSSSSSSSTAVVPRTRPQPITSRRRLDAAWEFGLWYVPNRAHQDLLALHPEGFEPQLLAWYERVVAEWASGTRGNPGSDMIKFWKLRHDEAWPPAPPIGRDAIGPVYTKVRQ